MELDENTGLRDTNVKYQYKDGESDPYMGIYISGGLSVSGEAPYVQYIDGYYYMFISYGGLVANGGYSMRVFRSENPTGPYVDETGDDARRTISTGSGNLDGTVGIKLMTYYKWNTMTYAQVAQGHNSAFVDEDGRAYVVFHTRTNDGTEGHYVKVHQLFTNEDGWLVAAPYAYDGEKISETGYKEADVIGTYGVLFHKTKINNTSLEYVKEQVIELKADGTITGDYSGTWSMQDGKPYVSLILGGKIYKGVLVKQNIEGTKEETMCFTVLGATDEVCVWGSKYAEGEKVIDKAIEAFTFAEGTVSDLSLPAVGNFAVGITWKSSNANVITNDGKVTLPANDTVVNMTATFKSGGVSKEKIYPVTVYGKNNVEGTTAYKLATYFTTPVSLADAKANGRFVRNPFNNSVTNGLQIYDGVTVKFDVEISKLDVLGAILSFNGNTAGDGGKLYFTGGSYLGYNATGGFFDANLSDYKLVKDYIGSGKKTVELKFTSKGFEVSVNGVIAYTNNDIFNSEATGKKDISSYANVIKWLNNDANVVNIGSGSWWADSLTEGKISNLEFWVEPIEKENTDGYAYYESFASADTSGWEGHDELVKSLQIVNDGNERANYLKLPVNSGVSGNRGVYKFFTAQNLSTNYTISLETSLTAGILTQRSESGIAILGTDADGYKVNNKNAMELASSGYILKLFNKPPEGTGPNQGNNTNQTKWTVNDSDVVIDIPVGAWVRIDLDVNTTTGKAQLVITDSSNGTVYYSGEININGKGQIGAIQMIRGRGVGTISLDGIKVKNK